MSRSKVSISKQWGEGAWNRRLVHREHEGVSVAFLETRAPNGRHVHLVVTRWPDVSGELSFFTKVLLLVVWVVLGINPASVAPGKGEHMKVVRRAQGEKLWVRMLQQGWTLEPGRCQLTVTQDAA